MDQNEAYSMNLKYTITGLSHENLGIVTATSFRSQFFKPGPDLLPEPQIMYPSGYLASLP